MPRLENEKNLGNVENYLSDRIDQAVFSRNNMKKKQFITAALEFFLSLPDSIIDTLILRSPESEDFKNIVNRFVASTQTELKERLPTLTGPAAAVADDAAAAILATKTRRKVGRRGSSKSA